MDWLVNIVGLWLIIFVMVWFWLGKKKSTVAGSILEVSVADGVYTPAVIRMKVGQPLTLRFIRKDETPCAEKVIFVDWNKSAELPIGKSVDVFLKPEKTGEFEFTCQMGMYRGKIIVEK